MLREKIAEVIYNHMDNEAASLVHWEDDFIGAIISVVADDIEKTIVRLSFESEGYLAGAQDEHIGIVEHLREQLDI